MVPHLSAIATGWIEFVRKVVGDGGTGGRGEMPGSYRLLTLPRL